MLPDTTPVIVANPSSVKRHVFCTGKVYYELEKERAARGQEAEVAITRIEQICPFPFDLVSEEIKKYPNADLLWSQEEHKNQGWYGFIQQNFDCVLRHLKSDQDLKYVVLTNC